MRKLLENGQADKWNLKLRKSLKVLLAVMYFFLFSRHTSYGAYKKPLPAVQFSCQTKIFPARRGNMSDSIITAVSVIGAVIVTFILEQCRKNGDFKRMIRHEAYQKRLALYEEIIKELSAAIKAEDVILQMNTEDFNVKVTELQHTLLTFINRLHIYGSPRSVELLKILISKLRNPTIDRIPVYLVGGSQYHKSLLLRIDLFLTEFAKMVREEMGVDFIDKEITKHFTEIGRAKKERQKVNKP
jgi:hypothetical protein